MKKKDTSEKKDKHEAFIKEVLEAFSKGSKLPEKTKAKMKFFGLW